MKHDKDMHRSRSYDVVTLGAVERHGPADARRVRPRITLACWVLLGVVPWVVMVAVLYR